MVSICVVSQDPSFDSLAKFWSQLLGAPYELAGNFSSEEKSQFRKSIDFFLDVGEQLVLRNQKGLRFSIDFDTDKINYQKKQIGRNHILARALGSEKGIENIHDLSCGLAKDAVILSTLGFQVSACERNQILWLILTEAQKKSQRTEIQKINFLNLNSMDYIANLPRACLETDAFYFDPMFPEKKKKALPRKEMQIFKALVGEDEDAYLLLSKAAELKVRRFVVKRPLRAKPLFAEPHHTLEGNLIRYDVYFF